MKRAREQTRRLSVQLVSDDACTMASLCAALRRRGHSVQLAADEPEALEQASSDVLVLDHDIASTDGLALFQALRARHPHTHALMVAAMPSLELCRAAMRAGAADLLSKPWSVDELIAAVEAAPESGEEQRTRLRLTQPSSEHGLNTCLLRLSAFALEQGVGPGARVRLVSACAELCDNVARHAYGDGLGPIELIATRERDGIRLRIGHRGPSLDPVAALLGGLPGALPSNAQHAPAEREQCSEPLRQSAASEAARGLSRVRALVEDVRFLELEEGSCVELWVEDAPLGFAEEGALDLSDAEWLGPDQARALIARAGAGTEELSPALRAALGRLLALPDPRETAQAVLWS